MPSLTALLACISLSSQAPQATPPPAAPKPETAPLSTELTPATSHHTLPSGSGAYTATAAQLPLRSDAGEIECRMFAVTYTKDGADPKRRPVTFVFNGGPGSASLWLHMGAVGPKRAPMNEDGSLPAPPYEAVDNVDTWLDFTDVVVVDAPATGYSRLVKPEFGPKYFGVQPDIAAFTKFVKGWLSVNNRWNSPLFIAGESYGGIRGSGLTDSLFGEGIALNGFISISGSSNFLTLEGMRGNDYTYLGFLPSMAACAWYHHKLAARFTSVEALVKETQEWAHKEYAEALERGDSLAPGQKEHVAEKLSEYLGLSKKYCFDSNLRIPEWAFFRELLRDQGLTIGRYDGRLTGKEEKKVGDSGDGDPSDDATSAPFTTTILGYMAKDLAIKTELTYAVSGPITSWSSPEGSYPETASNLRHVLSRNPHFHVLYCCGYYDLACPLNATVYTVNHMGLDAETRSRVSFQFYPAGHMMYIEKSSRMKLHNDVSEFERACLAGK